MYYSSCCVHTCLALLTGGVSPLLGAECYQPAKCVFVYASVTAYSLLTASQCRVHHGSHLSRAIRMERITQMTRIYLPLLATLELLLRSVLFFETRHGRHPNFTSYHSYCSLNGPMHVLSTRNMQTQRHSTKYLIYSQQSRWSQHGQCHIFNNLRQLIINPGPFKMRSPT